MSIKQCLVFTNFTTTTFKRLRLINLQYSPDITLDDETYWLVLGEVIDKFYNGPKIYNLCEFLYNFKLIHSYDNITEPFYISDIPLDSVIDNNAPMVTKEPTQYNNTKINSMIFVKETEDSEYISLPNYIAKFISQDLIYDRNTSYTINPFYSWYISLIGSHTKKTKLMQYF